MPQKSVNAAKNVPVRIFDFTIRLHLIFYASQLLPVMLCLTARHLNARPGRSRPAVFGLPHATGLFLVRGVFCFFASGKAPSSYKLFVEQLKDATEEHRRGLIEDLIQIQGSLQRLVIHFIVVCLSPERSARESRWAGVSAQLLAHLLIWCFLALAPPLWAQDSSTSTKTLPQMTAYRLDAAPRLDGFVDDEWMWMEPATDYVQQLPHEGQPATERTEVRVGYTEDTLYIAVICFDSQPGSIVSTQGRRDGLLDETDSFEMLLDTYNDNQNGYIFATTPSGIEYDVQIVHGGQSRATGGPVRAGGAGGSGFGGAQRGGSSAFNLNWDGAWRVRTQVTTRGWEAEFAIPFRTIRYASGLNQVWGINFKRNIRRKNEQVFWAPVSRGFQFHRVSLAGELHDLDVRFRRNLQIIPFVIGGFQQDFSQSPARNQATRDIGVDLKYTLTSSLTLDVSANTDFSQVEVDEEQINLTRFDLFFPEKRLFFLENAGYFNVGTPREVELFFSRRIGIDPSGVEIPIVGGVRVSGKHKGYNIGFLNMQTQAVGGVAPTNNFTVARLSREFGARSSIGVLAINKSATSGDTGSIFSNTFNRTFGVDANLGLGEHLTFFNYLAKTQTPGLQGRDHAASSEVRYDSDLLDWQVGYTEVGEDFNPEVGFVRRVGYRKPSYGVFFSPRPKNSRLIRRFWPHHSWRGFYRFYGRAESVFRHNDFRVFFQNGSSVGLAYNQNLEQLFEPFEISSGVILPVGTYRFNNWVLTLESDESARLFARANYSQGQFYSGHIKTLDLRTGIRSTDKFLLSTSYIRNDVTLPVGDFTTHLAILQFNYSFTPKSYIQSLIQYNSAINQIGTNIRFALLRTSNTGLFVVYTSRFDTTGFDPHENPILSPRALRNTLDRALIAKFTYLFDF